MTCLQSLDRSVARPLDLSISRSVDRSIAQSLDQSIAGSLGRSVDRSIARSLDRSIARSLGRSVASKKPPSVFEVHLRTMSQPASEKDKHCTRMSQIQPRKNSAGTAAGQNLKIQPEGAKNLEYSQNSQNKVNLKVNVEVNVNV